MCYVYIYIYIYVTYIYMCVVRLVSVCACLFVCQLLHSFTHAFIPSLLASFINSSIHSFSQSCIKSFTYPFIHASIQLFLNSCVYWIINLSLCLCILLVGSVLSYCFLSFPLAFIMYWWLLSLSGDVLRVQCLAVWFMYAFFCLLT